MKYTYAGGGMMALVGVTVVGLGAMSRRGAERARRKKMEEALDQSEFTWKPTPPAPPKDEE